MTEANRKRLGLLRNLTFYEVDDARWLAQQLEQAWGEVERLQSILIERNLEIYHLREDAAALRQQLADEAKADTEINEMTGKYMADVERLEKENAVLRDDLDSRDATCCCDFLGQYGYDEDDVTTWAFCPGCGHPIAKEQPIAGREKEQ